MKDEVLLNKSSESDFDLSKTLTNKTYEWGQLDIDRFLRALTNEGVSDPKIEHNTHGYTIHLVSSESTVILFLFLSKINFIYLLLEIRRYINSSG